MLKSACQWLLENKDWMFSGAGIVVIGALVSGFNIYKDRIRKKQMVKHPIGKKSDKVATKMLNVDESILSQLSNIFTGNTMYMFFYNLEDRIIYHEYIDKFDLAIDRFLSSDKVFRDNHLEEVKIAFLN